MSPVLTRIGGYEAEALTVNIEIVKINILCCTAYGPQKSDLSDKKANFLQYLDEEAKSAESNGKGFLLQGDLNSWLGSDEIPNDPRNQNDNGKRFKKFLMSNSLSVVNALKSCKGLITRIGNRQGQIPKSVIDFFVVCKRLLPHGTEMIVDENREMTITNYHCAKCGKSAVDSDHVTLMLKMNLNVLPNKPQRVEMLDLRNTEGKILFKKKTTETSEFTAFFKNMLPLLKNCERWNYILKAHCKN